MVGVPVLLIVCVSAFVPFVWVMVVGEGCSGWRVFQRWVAVVRAGVVVFWLVLCVGVVLVWLCVSGVVGVGASVG